MTKATAYLDYDAFVGQSLTHFATIPHCDSRILHSPDDCEYCAERPDLQAERTRLGIAWTGYEPGPGQIPCEADLTRPPGADNDHRRWGGNKPTNASANPQEWPEESASSQMLYGDPEYRYVATKEEKAFAPWYMKPVCRNDDGTTTGYDFKWWAKPFKRWLW
jgi:hypothetical protein